MARGVESLEGEAVSGDDVPVAHLHGRCEGQVSAALAVFRFGLLTGVEGPPYPLPVGGDGRLRVGAEAVGGGTGGGGQGGGGRRVVGVGVGD